MARRSVRRYDRQPLDPGTLAQVREIVAGVEPLVPENRFEALVRDELLDEDLAAVVGAYGRFVTPPHALAPYVLGQAHALADLGYRVEQIVVRLARLGVGSCYIGALRREGDARRRLDLPDGARIGALLIFGWPATAVGGRTLNALVRVVTGCSQRLPVERLFFVGSFDHPATPSRELSPLIEAARHAPSAVNAQPWRFLWRDERLHLFVTRDNPRYRLAGNEAYRLHDGGICMANVRLAMEALGVGGRWVVYQGTEPDVPAHPPDLQPLARLDLAGA